MAHGYRVVSIDTNTMQASTLMTRMPVDLTLGSVHSFRDGLYLGSCKSFCDYYLESTDDADLILIFDFNEKDIIHGSVLPGNEILVSKATLVGIEFVDPVMDYSLGKLLREPPQRYDYAIQCDKLRDRPNGEAIWLTLMRHAERIAPHDLLDVCNIDQLTEGESLEDFTGSDPQSGCYKTKFLGKTTYFIQTRGFEFFFTPDGLAPQGHEPETMLDIDVSKDSQAMLLLPANNPRANGSFGFEMEPYMISDEVERIVGDRVRYRLVEDGIALAGMELDGDVIERLYVATDARHQDLHLQLSEAIRNETGAISDPYDLMSAFKKPSRKREEDSVLSM